MLFRSAIDLPDTTIEPEVITPEPTDDDSIPTQVEMDSFYLLKSILREVIDTNRIEYKNTKNYFGINVDGSVKKTICRLWLNSKNKYIGIFDVSNKVVKQPIEGLDDIYGFSEMLKDRAKFLTQSKSEQPQVAEI